VDLFKDKEPEDTIKKSVDPDEGRTLEINYDSFTIEEYSTKSIKASGRKRTNGPNTKSTIETIEEQFQEFGPSEEQETSLALPEDFAPVVISIEEYIDFLDESEDEI